MLKRDWPLTTALFAIALALVLCWTDPQSRHDQNAGHIACTTRECRDEAAADTLALYTEILAWFTGVLALASIAQGYVLIRAERLTRRSIELARAEFTSTHRPKVILREAIIGSVLEGEPIHPILHIANVGETDAVIVRSMIDIEVVNTSTNRLFLSGSVEPYNEIGTLLLRAGEARLINWASLSKRENSPPPPRWESERYKLKSFLGPSRDVNGRATHTVGRSFEIHLIGQFIYQDGAGIHRRTAFRRKLIPERQRFYIVEDEPDLDYAD